MIVKIIIGIILLVLLLIFVYNKDIRNYLNRESFQQYVHERSSMLQDNENAERLNDNIMDEAHMQTSVSSNKNYEVQLGLRKELEDEYSSKYADCQRASLSLMPTYCILCIDPQSGNILEKTINGPGNQNKNYFTPCPCAIKNANQAKQIQQAIQCKKLKGSFSIVGTDCSYIYHSKAKNDGHGILLDNDGMPVLDNINKELKDCQVPSGKNPNRTYVKDKNNKEIILSSMDARTSESAAKWIAENYKSCEDIDMCMPELNENMNTITQDCAVQIYNKYGQEKGSANPIRKENYEIILKHYKSKDSKNIPKLLEADLKSAYENL